MGTQIVARAMQNAVEVFPASRSESGKTRRMDIAGFWGHIYTLGGACIYSRNASAFAAGLCFGIVRNLVLCVYIYEY